MNQKIKEDLVKYLLKKTHVKKIAPNTDLIEKSIIDSFGIVEFISYIEKKYNIKIKSNDLKPPNFQNLKNIEKLILKKLK